MNELLILILILLFLIIFNTYTSCSENFTTQESTNEKIPLYIFLSNNCKFCKEFEKDKYERLVNEIEHNYNIKKVYLENNKDLFIKYNIFRVPTALIEFNNKTAVADELTKESIIKAHNSLFNIESENDLYMDTNNNKKELKIFLSKNCPYCINYLNTVHKNLIELLKDEFNIKLIFTDSDTDNLFNRCKIQYVPKAIVVYNGIDKEVTGPINYENIKKASDDLDNKYELIHDETNNKKKILVFLSKRCPYCIRYDNETHDKLSNELKDKYELKRIYDDDKEGKELFNKYNISFVPQLLINDVNGKHKEIKGPLTRENILKTDTIIEHLIIDNNESDENNNKNNNENNEFLEDDCKSLRIHKAKQEVYEELENKIINDKYTENKIINDKNTENKIINNNKKKIIIFLSKTCPGCINYLKNIEDKVKKEFSNEYIIENKFIDEDEKLFIKHDIEYVPQAMVFHENKNMKIDGYINVENIKSTIEKLNKEGFSNIDNNIELLVFLTKTCPHCVIYDNQIHKNLENKLKNKCKIRKIYVDNDKDKLFEKYNIEYVPKGLLLSNERYVPIEGALDNETICKYLDKINN
jgi:thiol-disulfide isomerase/thioredoxin